MDVSEIYENTTKTGSKVDQGFSSFGDVVINALYGLADWVGLGQPIKDAINDNNKLKPTIEKLGDRLSQAVTKGQLEIDQVQKLLDTLSTEGFNLTGVIANKVGKAKKELSNKLSKAKQKQQLLETNVDKARTDLEQAKDVSTVGKSDMAKNIVRNVENFLGGIENESKSESSTDKKE